MAGRVRFAIRKCLRLSTAVSAVGRVQCRWIFKEFAVDALQFVALLLGKRESIAACPEPIYCQDAPRQKGA